MKNAIWTILGVIATLWVASKLPTPSAWDTCGFVGIGLALLTLVAFFSKAGSAMVVLGLAILVVGSVAGGYYAPSEFRALTLVGGFISGCSILVMGIMLVMGVHKSTKPERIPPPGHIDSRYVMS